MPQAPHLFLKRDQQGRISERVVRLGDSVDTRRYAYDSAGRLSRVTDGSGALSECYTNDHQGRRLADINPLRLRGERRYTYLTDNRLGQPGNTQYGHDKAGIRNLKVETTSKGQAETHYHFEPSGLLMCVDLPDGRKIQYLYDENGQRTEKRVNGQLVEAFRWLDPLRLSEFHDVHEWRMFAYLEDRTPVGLTNGEDMYFILADQIGTPLALATADGHVVQAMQYDSFGNPLRGFQGPVSLPIGFAGGLFDADTGLTRFVWRDYDADTGRFTALDPLGAKGGDKDWYGYCVDDPVNRVDVWGLAGDPLYDFGGEGRTPIDGPKYGNYCGKNWTGGWNPDLHGGMPGPLPSTDSADEKCRIHDFCYGDCTTNEAPVQCKADCDDTLVRNLESLPKDSSQWELQPPPSKEDQAEAMRDGALWWFGK
ncbi:MAG: hypothetical protein KKF77_04870 [Proteobacteria bacterium]|nr:hypothetical protein [Pseudomonadota bacterium]